jgi:hypothetical protein
MRLFWLATLAVLSAPLFGQGKSTFTLHVAHVERSGTVVHVEGESTAVRYKLSCVEGSKQNTCYMPQAGKDYQAKVAQNPEYLYVYGITDADAEAIFIIDVQQEKPRPEKK